MMTLVSLIFNLLFFALFSHQVVTKHRCMLGHSWSKWTPWSERSSPDNNKIVWKQERVCKRCYKPDMREIGSHRCSTSNRCPHKNEYLSLVDSTTNIKALESELGL